MARFALTCVFFMLCAIFALSPVKAFSPAQLDPAVRLSSDIVHVAKKCDLAFKRCVKACKKDTSCVSVCAIDRDFCNAFCPFGPNPC